MRLTLDRCRVSSLAIALAVAVFVPGCSVEAGDEAAHAIAEKFAADTSEPITEQKVLAESTAPPPVTPVIIAPVPDKSATQLAPKTTPKPPAPAQTKTAPPPVKTTTTTAAQPAPDAAKAKADAAKAKAAEAQRKRAEAKRIAEQKAEATRQEKARRKADEDEMLARARAEAEERRLVHERRLRDIERAEAEAEAERVRAAALTAETERRKAAEAEAARVAEAKRIAEEEERKAAEAKRIAEAEEMRRRVEAERVAAAERARAEDVARRHAEEQRLAQIAEERARRAREERRLAIERQLAEEEARRAAEARAVAALAAEREQRQLEMAHREAAERETARQRVEQDNLARLEAAREEEARRLSDRIRRTREARIEQDTPFLPPQGLGGPLPNDLRPDNQPFNAPRTAPTRRVTVLLVMEPGRRGIRRFDKSADPVICVNGSCYVSRGASASAQELPRGRAFGPSVALGSRAGACNNSLTCVFRGVDLGRTSAEIQPIDLRVLRHDRRQAQMVEADPTCRVIQGQLSCRQAVFADDYMMWVVPEAVASHAGPMALEAAVQSGLATHHSTALD